MKNGFFRTVFLSIIFLATPVLAQANNGETSKAAILPATAEIVRVGFYPINVYGVDYTNSTFQFDGYVWLIWKSDEDPTKTLEFVNAVNKSDLTRNYLFEAPKILPDGSKYQIMRVESQFFKAFSLADFPLDRHELSITVEDSVRGADRLVYEIDRDDTGYSRAMAISGWRLNGWNVAKQVNDYRSNFGDSSSEQASKFARLSFGLIISRPESYFFWKLLLPLVIVLCGAWIALLLNPALTETRAALPASALLTTVFLQQSYADALPDTGGLVLIDKIYVIVYILIVATLGRVIVKSRSVEQMNDIQLLALRRTDTLVLIAQAFIFVVSAAAIISLR